MEQQSSDNAREPTPDKPAADPGEAHQPADAVDEADPHKVEKLTKAGRDLARIIHREPKSVVAIVV